MKSSKLFMLFALVACVSLFGFCVCGGDDDDDDGVSSKKASKLEVFYQYTFSADFLSIADVKIAYYDASGTLQTETVSGTTWTKSVTYTTFPAEVGTKVTATQKSVSLTKDQYAVSWTTNNVLKGYYADGTNAETKKYSTSQKLSVNKAKVADFFKKGFDFGSFMANVSLSSDKTKFIFE